jgi:vacuolar-type H+-ATPase subunit H
MNADYDTRDSLKPIMKTDFNMTDIGVKDAFTTFVTIQKFAPAAKGIDGKMNVQMAYESQLGNDMMPVVNTINGSGKLHSDAVTLVESATFDKMKEVLKLGDKYTNTFKDLNVSFKIANGRIYVSPFDTKVGNIKMNISGDQGLDQTLNYLVKTEIPRSDLGGSVNSLIDNISSSAASLGFTFKPADVLKINVKVTGVFGKPVVMPVFGGGGSGESSAPGKEAVKQIVTESVDKGKEQLRKEAEIQGDKLIQEAETRGQQLRDEASRASENLKKEAEVQAQKLLDDSASKGAIAKMAAQKGADALRKEADKRGNQLVQEADVQAKKLVEEAKAKKEEMINKI